MMILVFCCQRWINLRLSIITTTIICFTSLFVILLPDQIRPEYAGLAIVYATQVRLKFFFLKVSNQVQQATKNIRLLKVSNHV